MADPNDQGFHGPSPILGPDGQPFRRLPTKAEQAHLGDEIAAPQLTGVRTFYDETVASGLTPSRLAVILRECVRGDTKAYLTLAEEMEERDLSYAAALGTRKRALSRLKPGLDDAAAHGVPEPVMKACREVLAAPAFRGLVKDLLDAIGKGFAVSEALWGLKDGQWWPQGYAYRDPKHFTFDYLSRTELRLAALGTVDGTAMPPAKFIRHLPNMKAGIPIRGGIARTVAWAWMFKMFTLKDWMSFLDVYGMPFRVGKYHPGATDRERRTLLQAVAGLASDAAAIIPESMQIEFIESKGFADQPFKNFGEYLDDQIATFVLGQTLTTRDGGSLGQAEVHNEIRLDLAEDDAFELETTIDRDLLTPFVGMNWGADVPVPRCQFPIPKPKDIAVLSTALAQLVPLGLEVDQDDVRDKLGIPQPAAGATLLKPPATGGAAVKPDPESRREVHEAALNAHQSRFRAGCSCRSCQEIALNALSGAEPDLVDAIGLDDSADWQAQTGPMLDAILQAAKASSSYAEFQAALTALYGRLNTKPLEDRLAIATAKAKLLGDITDHP